MPESITFKPSGHQVTVEAGETVLEATLRQGLSIPYGCRNGACGSCKGKVLEGQVDYGTYQAGTLTEAEKAAGYALFCCARPLGDLVLESREVRAAGDIQVKTLPARVQAMDKVSHDVIVLSLKLPATERLQFLAGQYIDVLLRDGKRRSFSLANAPHDDAFLQLHIRHVPGGLFTDQVFNSMKEKTILRIRGPLGSFYLREESDKPIIFMAGGTGFAPIKGIIEHAFQMGVQRQMVLYWGCRSQADLYLPELPHQWQEAHRNFTFIPVLSNPQPDDNWTGRTGYVHEAILADFQDLSGYQVYASGSPQMVDAGRNSFTARGLPAEEFFADSFTYAVDPMPPA